MNKKLVIAAFFLFIIFTYIHNLTRDIYGGDIGDLVTAAYVFGVPHPPGYPLFTFLGFLLSKIPLDLAPVFKIGLISAISSVLALFFYFKYSLGVSKSLAISFLSTSILAFSYLFWLYAEIPEVFALNNLFAVIILYTAVLFYNSKNIKYFYLLAFLCALSLTHHHTILLIFPSIVILSIRHIKIIFSDKRIILLSIFYALIGITPYFYVPIAASFDPVVNWDNASNLFNFIRLITRADYGSFAPPVINQSPLTANLLQIQNYFITLTSSVTLPVILISIIGAISMIRRKMVVLSSLLLAYILTGPFFVYYSTPIMHGAFWLAVMERFFILSSVILLFFLPYGFKALQNLANRLFTKKIYSRILIAPFFLLPLFMFIINFESANLSSVKIGNNFGYDLLSSLPKNTFITFKGDTEAFNSWYVHFVLGFRPDITIVTPNQKIYDLIENEKKKVLKSKPNLKEEALVKDEVLKRFSEQRPVYQSSPPRKIENYIWVPYGLASELVKESNLPSKDEYVRKIDNIFSKFHIPYKNSLLKAERNLTPIEIPMLYSNAFINAGDFVYFRYKDIGLQKKYYKIAVDIDPDNPEALAQYGINLLLTEKNCNEAEKYLNRAISNSFINLISAKDYYIYLYQVYKECKKNDLLAALEKEFDSIYSENLETLYKTIVK